MAEIKNIFFWRAILAEFLGVTLYVCIFLGVVLSLDSSKLVVEQLRVALCSGFALACCSYMVFPASGGHLNPAVTISFCICRRISILRMIMYIIVQCGGGITGTAILYALTPSDKRSGLFGLLYLQGNTTKWQGFALEGVLGFLLCFVFLSATDPKRRIDNNRPSSGFGPPLAYGLMTTAGHLMAIQYTGCGMNPARVLGPAVVKNIWPNYHWIYWAGPIAGGLLAGTFYALIFAFSEESTSGSVDITNDYIVERLPGLEATKGADNGNTFIYGESNSAGYVNSAV
eukprot:gene2954-3405_t